MDRAADGFGGGIMTYKCDWPPFEMTTSQPFSDNWAVADNEAGEGCVPFLPHDVLVCPKHSEMLEEIICNPELLDRETEPTLGEAIIKALAAGAVDGTSEPPSPEHLRDVGFFMQALERKGLAESRVGPDGQEL
jgi:hypothetical protein